MVSDGRVVSAALAKASCRVCGCAVHLASVDTVMERYSFGAAYALPSAAPNADSERARSYLDLLSSRVATPSRVLEMGCGSGRLLRELAALWPDADLVGVDPALPDGLPGGGRLTYLRGGFDAAPSGPFDLIVSINAIEHVPDPGALLGAIAERLSPDGQAAVVCPAATPPNVELLMFDHLYSLTRPAVEMLGRRAGLAIGGYESAPVEVGDFQLMILHHAPVEAPAEADHRNRSEAGAIHHARSGYLEAWLGLQQHLVSRRRPGRPLLMFGAGQMAALLRAYAPDVWRDTAFLVMDNPQDAWTLGKPVQQLNLDHIAGLDADVVIATKPSSQAGAAARLRAGGLQVIRFDDLIGA